MKHDELRNGCTSSLEIGVCHSHMKERERNRISWVILPTPRKRKRVAVVRTDLPSEVAQTMQVQLAAFVLLSRQTKTRCIPFSGTILIPYSYSHQLCSLWSKPRQASTAAVPITLQHHLHTSPCTQSPHKTLL